MTDYYSVLSGPDVGGCAGVAYIKNCAELNILPKQGIVKDWGTKYFSLKDGEYTDYLTANIGCRLCSEKLSSLLENLKSKEDILQWLDVEVESETGDRRKYYILHFPNLIDALDKKRSKYSANILTKHVINEKACSGHDIFNYIEGSSISFVISENVRKELKNEKCRGLVYLKISSRKKINISNIIKNIFQSGTIESFEQNKKQDLQENNLSSLKDLNLPDELVNFIREGKGLSYNEKKCLIGKIELVPIELLKCGKIYIDSNDQNKKGYYVVPAVDIILECEGFDAWGILVWLPDEKMFGTWDSDHRILRVFQNIKWSDIIKEPIKYLNALWEPQKIENIIYVPNQNVPFIEERAKQ